MVVSGAVWPQFAIHFLTGGYELRVWGRVGHRRLEMGPPNSPVVTSYRLPIVTIGILSPFWPRSDLSQKDRRNLSSEMPHYALKCIGRQKIVS